MKKYLLLLLCITAIGVSSCKKEVITQVQPNRTIIVDVLQNQWQLTSDNLSYFKEIALPENDAYFNANGAIVVGLAFDNPRVFEGLPHVFSGLSYRYTTEVGKLTLYVNNANGGVAPRPNYDVTAKITLIDGQLIP